MQAKPDCTDQKFGRLLVLGKTGKRTPDGNPFWLCQCDCGNLVERRRQSFERSRTPSCGCFNRERFGAISTARSKPDPTGERFGRLVVIGKDPEKYPNRNRTRWLLQCDCGNTTSLLRGDFDKEGGAKSCGCLYRDRKGKPCPKSKGNYKNKRFGCLTAIHRVPNKLSKWGKPVWLCQCDCGKEIEVSSHKLRMGWALHCGDRSIHPWGFWYPPTPSPYPSEAAEIVQRYLHWTKPRSRKYDAAIQDEMVERLLRSAWILVYRRQRGEEITELNERRYIRKVLRFCRVAVRKRYAIEYRGGFDYNRSNSIRIGSEMTNDNISSEAVAQAKTLPGSILSKPKKLSFKRR